MTAMNVQRDQFTEVVINTVSRISITFSCGNTFQDQRKNTVRSIVKYMFKETRRCF